jgi:hypothetical protein
VVPAKRGHDDRAGRDGEHAESTEREAVLRAVRRARDGGAYPVKRENLRVRLDGEVRLRLRPRRKVIEFQRAAPSPIPGTAPPRPLPQRFGEIRIAAYRLDTFAIEETVTGGPRLSFRQMSYEEFVRGDENERWRRNLQLLSMRDRITHPNSDREPWNTWRWTSSEEVDGAFVTFYLDNADPTLTADERTRMRLTVPVLGDADRWRRQVPVEDRIAFVDEQLDAEPAGDEYRQLQAVKRQLLREQGERWEQPLRVGRSGIAVVQANPGLYHLSMSSDRIYNPIRDGYTKATREARFAADAVRMPGFGVGHLQSCHAELWATPQQHRYFFQWFDVYIWGSLFAFGVIYLAQARSYLDSLPWYPRPYRMTSAGVGGGNDEAIAGKIARTNSYASAIRAGPAANRISPYFTFIHADRIEGIWQLFRRTEYRAGELAGIVRVNHPSGEAEEAYLWNTEREVYNGGNSVMMDSGILQTQEVKPFIGLVIENIGF